MSKNLLYIILISVLVIPIILAAGVEREMDVSVKIPSFYVTPSPHAAMVPSPTIDSEMEYQNPTDISESISSAYLKLIKMTIKPVLSFMVTVVLVVIVFESMRDSKSAAKGMAITITMFLVLLGIALAIGAFRFVYGLLTMIGL